MRVTVKQVAGMAAKNRRAAWNFQTALLSSSKAGHCSLLNTHHKSIPRANCQKKMMRCFRCVFHHEHNSTQILLQSATAESCPLPKYEYPASLRFCQTALIRFVWTIVKSIVNFRLQADPAVVEARYSQAARLVQMAVSFEVAVSFETETLLQEF